MRRLVPASALAGLLTIVPLLAGPAVTNEGTPVRIVRAVSELPAGWTWGAPEPCHEDQPCWDCRTMGNRICGVEIGEAAVLERELPRTQ